MVEWFFYGDACERLCRGEGFVYMFCLYTLFIQVIVVAKVFKGFRFDPEFVLSRKWATLCKYT